MSSSLPGKGNFNREKSQSNSYPSLQQKQQISLQNPAKDDDLQSVYSSRQTLPSVEVITSQQNPSKNDYHSPSSQDSDQRKQPQAFSGVVSSQQSSKSKSNQLQPQQELPSKQALPLSQNPPKTNHPQPPSSRASDKSQKEEPHRQQPTVQTSEKSQKLEQPTKDNHHLFSNRSSNQPQHGKELSSAQVPHFEQNPGEIDNPPPRNQTSHHFQPKSGTVVETYPSNGHLQNNQQQPPSDKKTSNQSQPELQPALPPRSKDNTSVLAVSTTTIRKGNPLQPTPVRANTPSQPKKDENPINNHAGVHDEPVLAYPDPRFLPPSYLNQLPPPPPPPRKRNLCCSIL